MFLPGLKEHKIRAFSELSRTAFTVPVKQIHALLTLLKYKQVSVHTSAINSHIIIYNLMSPSVKTGPDLSVA